MKDDREHIAILGGGVGGCVAAYWLSSTEELRKKYRVTLYQTGWRLGESVLRPAKVAVAPEA